MLPKNYCRIHRCILQWLTRDVFCQSVFSSFQLMQRTYLPNYRASWGISNSILCCKTCTICHLCNIDNPMWRWLSLPGFPDSMSMELHSRSSIRDSTFFFRIGREGVTENSEASASGQATDSAKQSEGSKERQHYHNQCRHHLYGWASGCCFNCWNDWSLESQNRSLKCFHDHIRSYVHVYVLHWSARVYIDTIFKECRTKGPEHNLGYDDRRLTAVLSTNTNWFVRSACILVACRRSRESCKLCIHCQLPRVPSAAHVCLIVLWKWKFTDSQNECICFLIVASAWSDGSHTYGLIFARKSPGNVGLYSADRDKMIHYGVVESKSLWCFYRWDHIAMYFHSFVNGQDLCTLIMAAMHCVRSALQNPSNQSSNLFRSCKT